MPLTQLVSWAQSEEDLFLTLECKDGHCNLSQANVVITQKMGLGCVMFTVSRHDGVIVYKLEALLYADIDTQKSEHSVSLDTSTVRLRLRKSEKAPWPRCMHTSDKIPYLRVDWSRWSPEEADSDDDLGTSSSNGDYWSDDDEEPT
jgi:hypothetical protein